MLIKLGYSLPKWEISVKSPVFWNTGISPHGLISGYTGGGKSVLGQYIVSQIMEQEESDLWIADYKSGGDWDDILPDSRYGEYTDCDRILNAYFDLFASDLRLKKRDGTRHRFLVFDEISSYLTSKDSKEFKDNMAKLSQIAFMGRAYKYHLLFIAQQFSSKVMDTAVREQLTLRIYAGRTISTENQTMLFPNSGIDKGKALPPYCGFVFTPEKELETLQIPYIEHPGKLKKLLIAKGKRYRDSDCP